MRGIGAKIRVSVLIFLVVFAAIAGLCGFLRPITNGCVMTYMYPTYIPITTSENEYSNYHLFLYHEGWKPIDFGEHLGKLSGVPVLFIPGNGGSFKQVRSLAAESDRAYQAGPPDHNFYYEGSLGNVDGRRVTVDGHVSSNSFTSPYAGMLDWFAVDLGGEYSAMDSQTLLDHTEHVVYAINLILSHYKDIRFAQKRRHGAPGVLPSSVILVGHSMGGFIARAAVVHPRLQKSAVHTILTLSSPHQSPPLALQPSLCHYFSQVNGEWIRGYNGNTSGMGHLLSGSLSHVVVVSVSGGVNDYQIRAKLTSLDALVPPSHGFTIGSTSMNSVWLSVEHQTILWCNQLVIQISHTLLKLIDSRTGQPFSNPQTRLGVFSKMLHHGVPHSFIGMKQYSSFQNVALKYMKDVSGRQEHVSPACPNDSSWNDGLEKDLHIHTPIFSILAMDGRRRWLDINKLTSNGKTHFMFVTNFAPCSGVRLHLWSERGKSASGLHRGKKVVDLTTKMVRIPSKSTQSPIQIEPGSLIEQAPASALFLLGPEDMEDFKYLTVTIAPRQSISGMTPPYTSMAVGQFFSPKDGELVFSSVTLFLSRYSKKVIILGEGHPLSLNISFGITFGLLPVSVSLETTGCGINRTGLLVEGADNVEDTGLCKFRCFPPVGLARDATSGLHIFQNLYSETILVESFPANWGSYWESEKANILLLVDPHCSYKATFSVSVSDTAMRFFIVYNPQIIGLSFAVLFFAMMRQAYAWESDMNIPSMLTAVESNLRIPHPLLLLVLVPVFIPLSILIVARQHLPPLATYVIVSLLCYFTANGGVVILILISRYGLYSAAFVHLFIKPRFQMLKQYLFTPNQHSFNKTITGFFPLKVLVVLKEAPLILVASLSTLLLCFLHPALGLFLLVIAHTFCCISSLSSSLTALSNGGTRRCRSEDGSSGGSRDGQIEAFHLWHGLLLLHLLASLLFVPSLVAWYNRRGRGYSAPFFLDSALCAGIVLHATFGSGLGPGPLSPWSGGANGGGWWKPRMSSVYLLAGGYSSFSAQAFQVSKVCYAMAAVGFLCSALRAAPGWGRDPRVVSGMHSHRH